MTDPLARLTTALADRYRIERELGAGGMATVYLAQDLRHDRKVAIKVLRPELAAVIGAERFLSEIKTTANLQHPHILPLFDSGAADGFLFYVMPFIEGESLRDRLVREQQLPVTDAIRIASEIASALEYAHRHNVIHRDIKPENILLHDGRALVADFGIALAASKAGGTRMTETGMSLGTPTYMSPEQAMGEREITARSDVYALGCVTYEMLIGEPPFTGPTAQAIIARVMTEDPRSLTGQRKTIPPHVEAAVATALSKLPADRFGSAAEFAEALAHPTATSAHAMAAARGRPASRLQRLAPWLVAAGAIAVAAWGWLGRAPRPAVQRQYITFGDAPRPEENTSSLVLSPDGQTLVIVESGGQGRLWIKRRGELDATPIPGTEGAEFPAVSPDGHWVAFAQGGQLRKARLGESGVVTLADSTLQNFGGVAWTDDGSIVYIGPTLDRISRISGMGGRPTVVLNAPAVAGMGVSALQALPGGRGLLFSACTSGCVTVSMHLLDLRTGEERRLLDGVAAAWYLPTGQLLYLRRDGVALLAPFDLKTLQLTGEAVPVLQRVRIVDGLPIITVARNGTLVYMQGDAASSDFEIVRVSRTGVAAPIDTAWHGGFNSLATSPDGHRVAVGVGLASGTLGIWIKRLDRGPFTRLTFGGDDRRPAWSPDGRTVAFIRDSGSSSSVYARPADGSTPAALLARIDRQVQEVEWSPDGRWLLLRTDNATAGSGDIVGVRVTGDTTPVPMVASSFTEMMPAVSPDSRWLAYVSDESGTNEVYVRPFPETNGARWQVSNGGGYSPRWSPDGHELFFSTLRQLVSAHVRTQPGFEVTELEPLFDIQEYSQPGFHQFYDVLPGGGFLFYWPRTTGAEPRARAVVQVDHWFDALASGGGR